MAAEPLIIATGVGKRFCRRADRALRYGTQDFLRDLTLAKPRDTLRKGEFWALKDASFTVNRGDVIGLLGHNGAGKSTMLKMLAGIYRPSLGSIEVRTHKIAVLDHAAGLNPMQTGRESIFTKLALLGLQMAEITDRIEQIVAIAELQDVIDSAVSTYSTGMRVRLAFAMYSTVDIDVFIIDDSLGVADIRFAQRMQRYWQDFVNAGGTLLLASHEMYLIRSLCTKALLFDHGRIVASGLIEPVVGEYLLKYLPIEAPAAPTPAEMATASPVIAAAAADTALPDQAGVVTAGQVGNRFFAGQGDFPIRVVAIETLSVPSAGLGTVLTQSQLTVRVQCLASVAANDVKLGIELVNAQGQVAIHVQGPDSAPFYTVVPGVNTFVGTLRHLPLMPGNYKICVGVVDAVSGAILGMRGWEDEGEPLCVLPDYKNDLLGAVARNALMNTSVTWQLDETGAAATKCSICDASPAVVPAEALRAA